MKKIRSKTVRDYVMNDMVWMKKNISTKQTLVLLMQTGMSM